MSRSVLLPLLAIASAFPLAAQTGSLPYCHLPGYLPFPFGPSLGMIASVHNAAKLSLDSTASSVAPGELIKVIGIGFSFTEAEGYPGPSTFRAESLPLPQTLGGTEVLVNGDPVPMAYLGPREDGFGAPFPHQLTIQLPFEIGPGPVRIELRMTPSGGTPCVTPFFTVPVTALAPKLVSTGDGVIVQDGKTQRIATADDPLSGPYATVYGIGFGKVAGTVAVGDAVRAAAVVTAAKDSISLTVDGVPVEILYAGATPGAAGLYQLNIKTGALARGLHQAVLFIDGQFAESFAFYSDAQNR